jgi:hypothetical protein
VAAVARGGPAAGGRGRSRRSGGGAAVGRVGFFFKNWRQLRQGRFYEEPFYDFEGL